MNIERQITVQNIDDLKDMDEPTIDVEIVSNFELDDQNTITPQIEIENTIMLKIDDKITNVQEIDVENTNVQEIDVENTNVSQIDTENVSESKIDDKITNVQEIDNEIISEPKIDVETTNTPSIKDKIIDIRQQNDKITDKLTLLTQTIDKLASINAKLTAELKEKEIIDEIESKKEYSYLSCYLTWQTLNALKMSYEMLYLTKSYKSLEVYASFKIPTVELKEIVKNYSSKELLISKIEKWKENHKNDKNKNKKPSRNLRIRNKRK